MGNFQGWRRIAFWTCFCTELIWETEQALGIKWKLSAEWNICHLSFLTVQCLWMQLITFKYDISDYFKSCHYKYQGKRASFRCPSHSHLPRTYSKCTLWKMKNTFLSFSVYVYTCIHTCMCGHVLYVLVHASMWHSTCLKDKRMPLEPVTFHFNLGPFVCVHICWWLSCFYSSLTVGRIM